MMMFRSRRGAYNNQKHHEHDSDTEEQQQPQSNGTDNKNSNSTTTPMTSTISSRKKKQRVFFPMQHYYYARRYEKTFFILFLAMMGCILTGCTIMVTLKLYTSLVLQSSNSSSYTNNRHRTPSKNLRDDHGYGNRDGFDEQDQRLDRDNNNKNPNGHRNEPRRHRRRHDRNHDDEEDDDDDYEVLPWNPIYRIPEASTTVGDRSDAYATLRKDIDAILSINPQRSMQRVQELQKFDSNTGKLIGSIPHTDNMIPYDIYNCPDVPPNPYPYQWKLVDQVLHDWPVNNVHDIPNQIYNGLCIFDYNKDFDKAMRYRNAELPFVVVNDPNVARTVERWAIPGYMEELLSENVKHRAEYNTNGHFMYHVPQPRRGPPRRDYRQRRHGGGLFGRGRGRGAEEEDPLLDLYGRPAKIQRADVLPDELRMTYKEWLAKANATTSNNNNNNDGEHWYFRLIGCGYMGSDGSCDAGSSEYLFDELPFFQPVDNLYLGQGNKQMGIHCRFGMPGVIAENHFDGSRNSIAVLRGSRRYILSHPNQCDKLTILPKGHPSARHSAVDYTNPDLETFPEFAEAMANEVVLQAGQVLYLPTNWFHFIVSLELNMQCNTRSGITDHYPLDSCGF